VQWKCKAGLEDSAKKEVCGGKNVHHVIITKTQKINEKKNKKLKKERKKLEQTTTINFTRVIKGLSDQTIFLFDQLFPSYLCISFAPS